MKPAKEVFNIINEHTRLRVEDPVAKVIEHGMIVGLANHTILVRKDGTEVPIDDSGAPIKDKDGNITGVVLVFRDITERKQATKEIESLAKFPYENPNPVVRASADGTIIYANESSAPLLDMWGAGSGQRLPDDYRNLIQGSLASGSGTEIEATFNGITYSLVIAPIVDMDYANIYGRDITGRKRAEDVLRTNLQRFYTVLSSMYGGVLLVTDENRIEYANQAFCDLFDLDEPPEELVGLPARRIDRKDRGLLSGSGGGSCQDCGDS